MMSKLHRNEQKTVQTAKIFFSGLWLFIVFCNATAPQPFGPAEQQHLTSPSVHQEFCTYSQTKYIHSNVNPLKTVTLPESHLCMLYCTLELDCFFIEYNPNLKRCKMYSSFTTCANHKNQGYENLFLWRTSFVSQSSSRDLCDQHAIKSVSRGGGCTKKNGQDLQYYSDEDYYYKYGAITGVVIWKKGFFRAIQLRYAFFLSKFEFLTLHMSAKLIITMISPPEIIAVYLP